jgi:tetratricopeptide (TPR) repeat protein
MGAEFDKFMRSYKELKGPESWQQISILGEAALEQDGLEARERWQIYIILVSNYYYLSRYEDAAQAAASALRIVDPKDNTAMAKNLYLASAAHRALCLHATAPVTKAQHARLAIDYIERALTLVAQVDAMTAGKVHFNAGALQHDVLENFEEAASHYQKAIAFYQQVDAEDDLQRTQIRYIRTFLDDNKPFAAQQEAAKIAIDPKTRTGVQCLLLKAKIELRLDRLVDAFRFANEGLVNAQEKEMKFEADQCAKLITQIKDVNPSIEQTAARINPAGGSLTLGVG